VQEHETPLSSCLQLPPFKQGLLAQVKADVFSDKGVQGVSGGLPGKYTMCLKDV
jgi:hypothetical protein